MSAHRLASGLGLAAVLAASLLATPASAWSPIDGSQPTWQLPVGYLVNQDTIPASISGFAVQRIDEGFAEWASPGCTGFESINEGDTNLQIDWNDGQNVLMWISNNWPDQLGNVNQVIGVTMPVWDQNGMDDADIVFNDDGFCWNDSGNNGCVDTASIVTHEEGHFIGLGHSNDNNATMAPGYPGGGAMASIEADDEDGVCTLYPSGGQQSSSGNPGSCDSCTDDSVQAACNGAYQDCGTSQACVDFSTCIQGCQSQGCVDQCAAGNPGGAQIYVDLVDCLCADCAVQCTTECGGSSSSSSSGAGPASAAQHARARPWPQAWRRRRWRRASGNAGVRGPTGSGDDGATTRTPTSSSRTTAVAAAAPWAGLAAVCRSSPSPAGAAALMLRGDVGADWYRPVARVRGALRDRAPAQTRAVTRRTSEQTGGRRAC